MTEAPLTAAQIRELRAMERKLLGERPRVVSVAAEEDRRPPWLRGRGGPRGLHGWLGTAPTKPTAPAPVAEATTKSWPKEFPDPRDAIRRRFEPPKLRMTTQDRDAPMMILITHQAYPSWDIAKIGESLGLPSWLVSLVLAARCTTHSNHAPAEGTSPDVGAASDSGWVKRGAWAHRLIVGRARVE